MQMLLGKQTLVQYKYVICVVVSLGLQLARLAAVAAVASAAAVAFDAWLCCLLIEL